MATSIGRWCPKRREKLAEYIIGFMVDENKWLKDYDQEFLQKLKSSERAQVQYWEALSFSSIVGIEAMDDDPRFNIHKLLEFLDRFETGMDAWGISDRLMNMKKPYLKLTKRQIALFVRRNIPSAMIEESWNKNCLLEFKVNGYREKIKNGLPKEWRTTPQSS